MQQIVIIFCILSMFIPNSYSNELAINKAIEAGYIQTGLKKQEDMFKQFVNHQVNLRLNKKVLTIVGTTYSVYSSRLIQFRYSNNLYRVYNNKIEIVWDF